MKHTTKTSKCSDPSCIGKGFERINHTCRCGKALLYECTGCKRWLPNTTYKRHSPCNDIKCESCGSSYNKKKKKHVCIKIKKHKSKKTKKSNDFNVKEWLSKFDMAEYSGLFKEEGFDKKESIKTLTPEYLKEMGVKMGHSNVIMNHLNILKEETKHLNFTQDLPSFSISEIPKSDSVDPMFDTDINYFDNFINDDCTPN
jgi:hypothetical protein